MGKLYFEDMYDLAYFMVENANSGKVVCAAMFYDEAVELLKELIWCGDEYDIESLELSPPDWDGYIKEYYITITNETGICVEPAYRGDRYLGTGADIMLLAQNVSSKIATCPASDVDLMYEIDFGECGCEDCCDCSWNDELASLIKDIFGVEPTSVEIKNDDNMFGVRIVFED